MSAIRKFTPSYGGKLSVAEIRDLAAFVASRAGG